MPNRTDRADPKATPARPPKIEHPHDETYTPGYHEGGSRFGFFNGHDNAGAPVPAGPRKAPDKR
jgi:hypothetical protein